MIIQKLLLKNYRNFDNFESNLSPSISLIIGENGVGKTNLLEALSFLAPGKGLRSELPEGICKDNTDHWQITSIASTKMGEAQLDVHYSKENSRKILHFNGSKITNSELANFINIIWLTPQMEGIFLGGPGDRRKFLDRMVFSSLPNHAQIVSKYEHQQKERMKILEHNAHDSNWLDIVEKSMAELGIAITENRLGTIDRINNNTRNMDGVFPKAHLELSSDIIELLNTANPVESIMMQYKANRERDRVSNRTNFGPQKGDMKTYYAAGNMSAESCSTGQQKALLISIIIAQQIATTQSFSCLTRVPINGELTLGSSAEDDLRERKSPILLLDEIFVHLDEKRRRALAEFLIHNKAQAFITATERDIEQYLDSPSVIELS